MPAPQSNKLRDWARLLKQGADAIGALLFILTFAGFIVQVFFRYLLNDPLAWSQEATMIAFIWAVFWAAAFMVPQREHVTFDVVYDTVPEHVKRWMAVFSMIVLAVAFVMLIPRTLDYLDFLFRKRSPVLRIQMTWIYGCYLLFIVGFTLQAVWRLFHLLGARWREHV